VSFIIPYNRVNGRFSYNRTFLSLYRVLTARIFQEIANENISVGGKFPIHPPRLKLEINYSSRPIEQSSKFCSSSTAALRQTKLISQSVRKIKFKVELKFEWNRSPQSRGFKFHLRYDQNTLSGAPFLIVNRIATITFSLRYKTFQSLRAAVSSKSSNRFKFKKKREREREITNYYKCYKNNFF